MEIVYENLQTTDFERIYSSGFSLLKPEKTASSEGTAESRQKPTAESEIGSEFEKISKKIFRNSADFASSRRILTHKRKPRKDAFEAFAEAPRRIARIHQQRL